MSLPSAPRLIVRVPPERPAPLSQSSVTAVRKISGNTCTVAVTIANAPQAHAKAVGKFRLAAWTQWKDHSIDVVQTVNGIALHGTLPELVSSAMLLSIYIPADLAALTGDLNLRLAVVDPVDRVSDLLTIAVQ